VVTYWDLGYSASVSKLPKWYFSYSPQGFEYSDTYLTRHVMHNEYASNTQSETSRILLVVVSGDILGPGVLTNIQKLPGSLF